ncbi:hypothetical protein AB0K68_20610 [Streptomyces sp. NPDC050698]
MVGRLNRDLVRLRLSGLARALYVCPPHVDPRYPGIRTEGRLVLGTPLYVEIGPWNPKW